MTGKLVAQARGKLLRPPARAYLLVALLVAGFVAYVYATQSVRSAIPEHGEAWADMWRILGARNLDQYGFLSLRLGITWDGGPEVGLPPLYRPHHPSLSTVVLASLYRLGFSTIQARMVPLLVASSALVALYLLVCRMTGDRLAGILALLALAAAAPFRLLADGFWCASSDFACEAWSLLFITLGSLEAGRRQMRWLILAGAGAFATIALSGFEAVPAIAAYSILFPLLLAPLERRGRLRIAFASGLLVGGGFVLGAMLRLAHNAWMLGGLQEAVRDLVEILVYRSSEGESTYWGQRFVPALLFRLGAYYPLHVLALGCAIILRQVFLLGRGKDRGLQAVDLRWPGLVLLCEATWLLGFRQHSHLHVHTISRLALGVSVLVAAYGSAVWKMIGASRLLRTVVMAGGVALFAASMTGAGLRGYGNLNAAIDWSPRQRQVEAVVAHTPEDAVVVLDVLYTDPATEFFLGRTFVRRPGVTDQLGAAGRPVYLLTHPSRYNDAYRDALATYRLVALNEDLALFDTGIRPGLMNALAAGPVREESLTRGTSTLGFLLQPSVEPAGGAARSVAIRLPPGEAEAVTLRVLGPELATQGDDVASVTFSFDSTDYITLPAESPVGGPSGAGAMRLTFSLDVEGGSTSMLRQIALDQDATRPTEGATAIHVSIPLRESPATLWIEASCPEGGDCEAGWVWVAPAAGRIE